MNEKAIHRARREKEIICAGYDMDTYYKVINGKLFF